MQRVTGSCLQVVLTPSRLIPSKPAVWVCTENWRINLRRTIQLTNNRIDNMKTFARCSRLSVCLALLALLLNTSFKLTIAKQHERHRTCANLLKKLRFLHSSTKALREATENRAPEYSAMTWSSEDRTVQAQLLSPDKKGDHQQWIAERRRGDGYWRVRTKEISEWYCLEAPEKAKDALEMQPCDDDLKSQAWMFSMPQTDHYTMQSASLNECVATSTRTNEYVFVSCDENEKSFGPAHRPCLFLIEDVIEDSTEDEEPSFMYDPYSVEE